MSILAASQVPVDKMLPPIDTVPKHVRAPKGLSSGGLPGLGAPRRQRTQPEGLEENQRLPELPSVNQASSSLVNRGPSPADALRRRAKLKGGANRNAAGAVRRMAGMSESASETSLVSK